jgi:hypothetical protein
MRDEPTKCRWVSLSIHLAAFVGFAQFAKLSKQLVDLWIRVRLSGHSIPSTTEDRTKPRHTSPAQIKRKFRFNGIANPLFAIFGRISLFGIPPCRVSAGW